MIHLLKGYSKFNILKRRDNNDITLLSKLLKEVSVTNTDTDNYTKIISSRFKHF